MPAAAPAGSEPPQQYSLHFPGRPSFFPGQGWLRQDELEIDFDDDRSHAVKSWKTMSDAIRKRLTDADYRIAREICDFEALDTHVRTQAEALESPLSTQMWIIKPLPPTLLDFVARFEQNVAPLTVDMSLLWSMVYYNIKLSCESYEKLRQTTRWLKELRRTLALCNTCMQICENQNELRIALPEILSPLLDLLSLSINLLLRSPTDLEYSKFSPQVEMRIKECLESLNDTLKYLNEINNYSKVNQERQVKFISQRTETHPELEEKAPLPIKMLPLQQNEYFYGREKELAAINAKLGPEEMTALQSYTIYGRRGVGKTHLALEYAYRNTGNFDAIFWIQCETSASLRQSIAAVATELNLPGASLSGHHEENLVNTHNWLRTTKARWLLVFDNAEKERLLTGYWPVGARGSILITSRTHYNFMKDIDRGGMTVPPFTEEESLELLLIFLGQSWQNTHLVEPFRDSDLAAARALMRMIGGLALAIEQAAKLTVTLGTHLRGFLDRFMEKVEMLPVRQLGKRDQLVQSLDTIWSIAFDSLSANARAFLGVLAFLAPDEIQLDLFLPRDQSTLQGKLEFCLTIQDGQEGSHAALSNVLEPPPSLQSVLEELSDAKLIIIDNNRTIKIHRVIQEAMNYQNFAELQDSFDAAVRLVYEAFPKQQHANPLHDVWTTCQEYIQHVVQLFTRFKEYGPSNVYSEHALEASKEFILLAANCGWYLLEVGDYDECLDMVTTAQSACHDQETLTVARLQNTAASAYFDLNKLAECRQGFEAARDIRESKLDPDDPTLCSTLANLGNLETAEENFEEARSLLQRAAVIREKLGESAATMLAVTYLQIGRVDTLEKKFSAALKMFQKSESLLNRQVGARNYLADLHYAYGNREYLQSRYKEARQSYTNCLKFAEDKRPLHPMTCAAYYKLGSCEYELENYERARKQLSKALNIAEIRNPEGNDGTVARILWKLALVLREIHVYPEEAQTFEGRAVLIRSEITGRNVNDVGWEDDQGFEELEHSYDLLVAGFFR